MSYDDSDNPAPWLIDTVGPAFGLPPGLGSAAGGILGFLGGKETNEANARLAAENREWQERMSNTAHQREMADLKAAGINPMLSGMRTGATTPPGNVATMQNAQAAGMSSAAQAASIENVKATTDQVKAQTELIKAQTPEAAQRIATGASTARHLDTDAARITQDMQLFNDRWTELKEQIELLKEKSKNVASHTDLNEQAFKLKVPQEIALMKQQAIKLTKESELLGLKVPEAVLEAALWNSPRGKLQMQYRHAPTWDKMLTGTIEDTAEIADTLGKGVTSAAREAFRLQNSRRIR